MTREQEKQIRLERERMTQELYQKLYQRTPQGWDNPAEQERIMREIQRVQFVRDQQRNYGIGPAMPPVFLKGSEYG